MQFLKSALFFLRMEQRALEPGLSNFNPLLHLAKNTVQRSLFAIRIRIKSLLCVSLQALSGSAGDQPAGDRARAAGK